MVGIGALCGIRQAQPQGQGQSFWVAEFVRLANGRHVILHDARGFDVSAPVGPGAQGAVRTGLTRQEITETVLAVVLPDPEDGEQHPWSVLELMARARGLSATAEDLRRLPYEVHLTDDVS